MAIEQSGAGTARKNQASEVFLETALASGILKTDPIWPLLVRMEENTLEVGGYTNTVQTLVTSVTRDLKGSLEANTKRLEAETEHLKAVSKETMATSLHEMGARLTEIAHDGWTRRARTVERRTVVSAIFVGALLFLAAYEIGGSREYDRGYATAQAEGAAKFSELEGRENTVARLFKERPGDMEKWVPIIERNRLSTSSALRVCLTETRFSFDADASRPGCWLPIWIGLDPDTHGDHTIPGPLPNTAPPGFSPDGLY